MAAILGMAPLERGHILLLADKSMLDKLYLLYYALRNAYMKGGCEMGATATLNVRLPESLKAHGSQVLERNGMSTSQAVRRLFEYMEREQEMPECIAQNADEDKYEMRRATLKAFAGCAALIPKDWTMNDIRDERLSRLIDGRLS